jgi:hypothetical protein
MIELRKAVGYAAVKAASSFRLVRRKRARPSAAKPKIINAQVVGSGTLVTTDPPEFVGALVPT